MTDETGMVEVREEARKRALLPYESAIEKARERFAGDLNYESEKIFAMQALSKTNYALEIANKNPLSVHLSMLNLSATGLTLNPALKYAYLVPRGGAICLDISYIGLLKIATDTGSIRWGRAAVVYERDSFTYNGPATAPAHVVVNPFGDRGAMVGVYCVAKTSDGDVLCDMMNMTELEKIRSKSESYSRSKTGPWVEFFEEQSKKAVIKRAQKTWPRSERLAKAVEIANESEGGYSLDAPQEMVTDEQAATLREWMETANAGEAFLSLFNVGTVEAIPRFRYAEALAVLKARAK